MKRLTAKFIAEVEAPGRHYDADAGLFLLVHSAISKSYVQRLTIHGKRRDIGLGSVRWTTLTEARAAAQANRKIARQGDVPQGGRRRDRDAPCGLARQRQVRTPVAGQP